MRKKIKKLSPLASWNSCRTASIWLCMTCWIAVCGTGPSASGQESVLLQDTPIPKPVTPPTPAQVERAIHRGVEFLVAAQNPNGSWGSATNTKDLNIYAPVPGAHQAFRTAVTGLAISALLRSADERPEVNSAIERGDSWLNENLSRVRRANQDAIYNVWAHAYAMAALADLVQFRADGTEINDGRRERIKQQIDMLARYESINFGWGYYDFDCHTQRPTSQPTSFTTATELIALDEARKAGVSVPPVMVQHAMTCIKRQQKPDFSYFYSYNGPTSNRPMWEINRPGGSLGRSQVCNLALRRWGDPAITDEVLEVWLDRLFARNLWLDIGRKRPIPHESHFLVAGYFFYYGHWYAAQCIDELPADHRQRHRDQMARRMVDLQEKDGSWWDYPFYNYHPTYGTAMAVMTLRRCLPRDASVRKSQVD